MYNPQLTYERIQQRCKEIGMKITDLNTKCNISKDTLSKAAKSSEGMKAANIFAVAQNIKCSADYLLGLTQQKQIDTNQSSTTNPREKILIDLLNQLSENDKDIVIGMVQTFVNTRTAQADKSFKEEEA